MGDTKNNGVDQIRLDRVCPANFHLASFHLKSYSPVLSLNANREIANANGNIRQWIEIYERKN